MLFFLLDEFTYIKYGLFPFLNPGEMPTFAVGSQLGSLNILRCPFRDPYPTDHIFAAEYDECFCLNVTKPIHHLHWILQLLVTSTLGLVAPNRQLAIPNITQ